MTEVKRYSFAGTPGLYIHESDFDALQRRLEASEARCAELEASLDTVCSHAGDLLEQLINATEGFDEPISDEEIDEHNAVIDAGLALVRTEGSDV